jgi:hypothetical protein
MIDAIKLEIEPSLYSLTGDIKDFNTVLINRAELAALRTQLENDEYNQGYIDGSNREAEIWSKRLDAERQRSVYIEAMNHALIEQLANTEKLTKPSLKLLMHPESFPEYKLGYNQALKDALEVVLDNISLNGGTVQLEAHCRQDIQNLHKH